MSLEKQCYLCTIRSAKITSDGVPVCEVCAEEFLAKKSEKEEKIEFQEIEASLLEELKSRGAGGFSIDTDILFDSSDFDDDKTPVALK